MLISYAYARETLLLRHHHSNLGCTNFNTKTQVASNIFFILHLPTKLVLLIHPALAWGVRSKYAECFSAGSFVVLTSHESVL